MIKKFNKTKKSKKLKQHELPRPLAQYEHTRYGRRAVIQSVDPDKMRIASDPDTEPEILVELTRDRSNDVRAAVASNPNSPGRILLDLMIDSNPYVRYVATEVIKRITEEIVTKNPSLTNVEITRMIKEDLY